MSAATNSDATTPQKPTSEMNEQERKEHREALRRKLHEKTSTLQTSFESYLAFITHIASLVIVVWNALHGYKLSLTKRLVFSLILQILLFVIILIFVDVDTDSCKQFNKIKFIL